MPLLGTIAVWTALAALLASLGCYLAGGAKAGRALFVLAALSVLTGAGALGTLLVTHRFDVAYVYNHSARGMAPLYWFPSFWAGQEGSFLLWGVWIAVLGVVLACTSGSSERRVMPVYSCVLLFLVSMLALRSPFLMLDTQGLPIPTEGLGLNPNLENPWMVIHPPTLFLGFAALTVPFAFALSALCWKDWESWLRRALPWGLFSFAVLGLAMMMGGYWAYEMLGWGGFWGWDPVENGPFIPWMGLIAFLHAAQIQRVRGGFDKAVLTFALLPFMAALYETFLTRTGVLDKFSVHSFSTLGGAANNVLLGVLLLAVAVSVGMLLFRRKQTPVGESVLEAPVSREFGYTAAISLLTLCALISAVGMSAPLLTSLGVKLHLATAVASVKEDFYNRAMFPIGFLLALGMGVGPHLAWRGRGAPDTSRLVWAYGLSVLAAIGYLLLSRTIGTALNGARMVPQLLLFTTSSFAVIANLLLLANRLKGSLRNPAPALTLGGMLSHLGAATMLLGIVCLVTFVQKDPDVLLIKDRPVDVLSDRYTMTYLGQTGDWQKDKDNALRFAVASHDGREKFEAHLPFALRPVEGGDPKIFGHPAIIHHAGGDLYLALKDGPDQFYRTPIYQPKIKLGESKQIGPYEVQFISFERDPKAAAYVQATGQMPAVFPVKADLRVTFQGKTTIVQPQFVMRRDNPGQPESTETKLPGDWLIAFQNMNAGSADKDNPNGGASAEEGAFTLRQDSGPPAEAFQLEVTTRPMISLVWIGTLLLVLGGFVSMTRRLRENRLVPIPDLPVSAPSKSGTASAPRRAKGRASTRKPAPSLSAGRTVAKSGKV